MNSPGPNGTLNINAGTFALASGALKAGSISIASGGTLLISQSYTGSTALAETIVNNGSITLAKSSVVTFNNVISGSGTVTVEKGASAIISTAISSTGSFILMDAGNLEFGAADSEKVDMSATTGTLKIDHSLTAPFTGQLSGLTPNNTVDLADLSWTKPSKMTASYAGNTTGGVLTVNNGSQSVKLNLLGNYTAASWTLSKDGSGGTLVVDPPANGSLTPDPAGGAQGLIDLSNISFGAYTTLGYSANSDNSGGTLTVSDSLHVTSLALLGQYAASSFVMASDGHGGTMISDPPPSQQQLLTQPHA